MITKYLPTIASGVWLAAASVGTPELAAQSALDGLGEYIESAMVDWQVPGLAIVVIQGDEIVYSEGFGVREAGKPAPVDLNTVFALSSTGKAYTATAIGIAVDQGRLRWDDPVGDYVDHFQLPDPWVTRMVTIRDLMSHRVSGDLGVGKLELWAFTDLERDAVLGRLRYLAPGPVRFRGEFQYSNPNISAAGQALGAALGTSWDELMRRNILRALGMRTATTSVLALWEQEDVAACYMCDLEHQPGHEDARIDNVAMPHVASTEGPVVIPWRTVDNIGPAGSINSSVLDFAQFVRLHLGGGSIDGERIVSERSIAETHTPQMVVRTPPYPAGPGFGSQWAYGLGWYLSEYHGRRLVMHTGGITGWRSAMVMLPDESVGVAVVSNGHGAHLPNTLAPALAFVVFDRLLGLPETDRSAEWLRVTRDALRAGAAAQEALAARRSAGTRPSVARAEMAGRYVHPAFGDLVIGPEGEGVRLAGVMDGRLEHWHHDLYRVTWIGPWPTSYFLEAARDVTGELGAVDLRGFGRFERRR